MLSMNMGSRWPANTDPDATAPEAEIPAERRRRGERDLKAQNYARVFTYRWRESGGEGGSVHHAKFPGCLGLQQHN